MFPLARVSLEWKLGGGWTLADYRNGSLVLQVIGSPIRRKGLQGAGSSLGDQRW